MALPRGPPPGAGDAAHAGRHQGQVVDPLTEEEPGRILHEVRLGDAVRSGPRAAAPRTTARPTRRRCSWCCSGELSRWGVGPARGGRAAARTRTGRCDWVEEYGDRDGDGFVEYQRSTDTGLVNQGWKDSWDGINFADGRLAEPPDRAVRGPGLRLRRLPGPRPAGRTQAGDPDTARDLDRPGRRVARSAFNEQFWLPDRGWYAIALDGEKRPVDACASNMGHCLWTGIVDEDKAPLVAEHLMSPEMFTGWGVRTLAVDMGAYNPVELPQRLGVAARQRARSRPA